ncbi:MAG: penicillin acylase family protein [Chitinophagales bacterium]|nr:penicillin acylase family protein [Chitinophagales bacterium]
MSLLDNISGTLLKPVIKQMSKAKLPQLDGKISLDGLTEHVEIIRDQWGVPHIYASNMEDLLFAQGFVHAQDRLWQMEMHRRAARGKLAEILGEKGIETDKICRTMGYERVAKNDWDLYEDKEQRLIKAYISGINAFIKKHPDQYPVEFQLLKIKPEPWDVLDVGAFSRLLISQLTWGWYDEIIRAKVIEKVGAGAASELDNGYPEGNPVTLPKGIEFNKLKLDEHLGALRGPYVPQISGSNAWTVSGFKTDTGKPYLCNDPHLPIRNPNIWYMVHLHCPEMEATGVSVPALPMVQIGHNGNIGWGITLSYTDLEDVFIEKFTDETCSSYVHEGKIVQTAILEEKIYVKGDPKPIIHEVMETVHGPIVSDFIDDNVKKLSLCSMALKPGKSILAWMKINLAKNWDDFVDGVSYISAPGLNICYADAAGNIGYFNSGKMPIRDKALASVPSLGWIGSHDWHDYVPFHEMPHSLNPERGYILTCNHKIEPDDFPYFMGDIYMNGYRAARLEELFSKKEKFEPKDFIAMQLDQHCVPGKAFGRLYKNLKFDTAELQQAADLLAAWDGVLKEDTIAGTFYKVTKYLMVKRIYNSALPPELVDELLGKGFNPIYGPANTFLGHNTAALLRMINNKESFWIKKAGGREKVLKDSLKDALTWLKMNYGRHKNDWQWGKLHAIVIKHSFSQQAPMDKVFNVGPYPIGGDTDTLCQTAILSSEGFGGELACPSYRQIIDFSNFDNSQIVMPMGQSGNMASPYYKNQLRNWFEGQYFTMAWSRGKVNQVQKHRLILEAKK